MKLLMFLFSSLLVKHELSDIAQKAHETQIIIKKYSIYS